MKRTEDLCVRFIIRREDVSDLKRRENSDQAADMVFVVMGGDHIVQLPDPQIPEMPDHIGGGFPAAAIIKKVLPVHLHQNAKALSYIQHFDCTGCCLCRR